MERILIALALGAVAAIVALVVTRRGSRIPVPIPGRELPAQLHRSDFNDPTAPWLVVLFSAEGCKTCASVRPKVEALRSDQVAVQEVDLTTGAELQRAYGIDAVPMVLLADADGVVLAGFLGPVSATDLWAAVAEVREPGSTERGCEDDPEKKPKTG